MHGVYGFLNMLARLVTDRRPAGLASPSTTTGGPTFRVDALPSYKTHRVAESDEEDDPVAPQEALGREVLDALGFAVVGADGFEAEDVIATLAARATAGRRSSPAIATCFALVRDPDVTVLYPLTRRQQRSSRVDEAEITRRYGIPGRALSRLRAPARRSVGRPARRERASARRPRRSSSRATARSTRSSPRATCRPASRAGSTPGATTWPPPAASCRRSPTCRCPRRRSIFPRVRSTRACWRVWWRSTRSRARCDGWRRRCGWPGLELVESAVLVWHFGTHEEDAAHRRAAPGGGSRGHRRRHRHRGRATRPGGALSGMPAYERLRALRGSEPAAAGGTAAARAASPQTSSRVVVFVDTSVWIRFLAGREATCRCPGSAPGG